MGPSDPPRSPTSQPVKRPLCALLQCFHFHPHHHDFSLVLFIISLRIKYKRFHNTYMGQNKHRRLPIPRGKTKPHIICMYVDISVLCMKAISDDDNEDEDDGVDVTVARAGVSSRGEREQEKLRSTSSRNLLLKRSLRWAS